MGTLAELQRRMDPCFAFLLDGVLGMLVDDVTVWAPDGGVSSSVDPSYPSHCPAVFPGLYPRDGSVYHNKQSHWLCWTNHSP